MRPKGLINTIESLQKENKEPVRAKKIGQKSIGTSFEPRLKTTYRITSGGIVLGDYEHTEIYQPNRSKKIREFGMMDLKESPIGTPRPNWHEEFMADAILKSRRSSCRNVHAGSVIVDAETHLELGSGYNGVAPGITNCLEAGCRKEAIGEKYGEKHGKGTCWGTHSEQNAASHITRTMNTPFVLYATIFPCSDCTNNLLAYNAFKGVFFKSFYDEREIEGTLERFWKRDVNVTRLDLSPKRAFDIMFNEPAVKITAWTPENMKEIREMKEKILPKNS